MTATVIFIVTIFIWNVLDDIKLELKYMNRLKEKENLKNKV